MNRPLNLMGFSILAFGFLSAQACVSPPDPVPPPKPQAYLSSSFSFEKEKIDHLLVFPIADVRVDNSVDLSLSELQELSQEIIEDSLKEKNYEFSFYSDFEVLKLVDNNIVLDPDSNWIKSLQKDQNRWVLFFALEDLRSEITFGSHGSGEMRGFLFDTKDGKTLWRHKCAVQGGQGGLIGIAFTGLIDNWMIQGCLRDLFKDFPRK